MKDTMHVFDPTTETRMRKIEPAIRPPSLKTLRIGLVDNRKFNSDTLLVKIATILEQEHGAKGHIIGKKHNSSVPAHEELIEELTTKCDVVIAGIGD